MELKLTNDEVVRALVDRFGPAMGGQQGDTFSVAFRISDAFSVKLSECVITRVDKSE